MPRTGDSIYRVFRKLSRPFPAAILVLAAVAVIAGFIHARLGVPAPQFHDAFSYLLGADTFASGRLTNPAPAAAEFFESYQVLIRPTYMSKYPPAHSMLLALGQVTTGEPYWGMVLGNALAGLSCLWLLRAIATPVYATIGAVLLVTHPLVMDWQTSYWGTPTAMIGSALMTGAALRIVSRRHKRTLAGVRSQSWTCCVGAIGLIVMINTRPFEGTVLAALLALFVLPLAKIRCRCLLPATGIMLVALALMGYYNHRVTGSATTFPYMEYEHQYALTPPLMFLPPPADKSYRHREMESYYRDWERPQYERHRSLTSLADVLGEKMWIAARSMARQPAIVVGLLAGLFVLTRDRRARKLIPVVAIGGLASLCALWMLVHYLAYLLPILTLLVVQTVRRWDARYRSFYPSIILIALSLGATAWGLVRLAESAAAPSPGTDRVRLLEFVGSVPGQHLIFVRPDRDRVEHFDWVYNSANPASQRILFLRDMGDSSNAVARLAYPNRTTWLIDPSQGPERFLTAYDPR